MKLKEQMQAQQKTTEEDTEGKKLKRKGIKSSVKHGKKDEPPNSSLSLEFVHG